MSAVCSDSPPRPWLDPAAAHPREAARRRWKILARALHRDKRDSATAATVAATTAADRNVSVRRFTTFQLVTSQRLDEPAADAAAAWHQYTATVEKKKYWAMVRQPTRSFTAAELMGFNNTGNVCVWPSEEVLAYYALCNLRTFTGKHILELGGGMTCLAGLMIAKYSDAAGIHLTDGNVSAVENVEAIVRRNCPGVDAVTCSVLQWGDVGVGPALYDVILSADCLFFDEARKDLVETMWTALRTSGVVLVMAPRRGDTLDKFAAEAQARGFRCNVQHYYNDHVWSRHLELKKTRDYLEDIHYPMLLQLTK